jgi:predicted ATPase/DNA-binding winged helix-turn-helix (wHTH) protein
VVDQAVAEHTIMFGPFRLLTNQRLLVEGDKPVRLGSRAFDILIALVERAGEVVGKDELFARAWPGTFVDESNLKLQAGALRRALGDGHAGNRYIATVRGRGYSLVAPVTIAEEPLPSPPQPTAARPPHNLPAQLTRLIGRTGDVDKLALQLTRHRLVTIVGPCGIGKTSVGLAVAEGLIDVYEHGVWLIDLAPLNDPRLVPSVLATLPGLEIRSDDPPPSVTAFLKDKEMLLVLDNCEHVIDYVADLAIAILKGARGVHILATSREPLRTEGEHVHRLSSLEIPATSATLTAAEALRYPAVQLFVERAAASSDEFELIDTDAPIAAEICRKLDGIALAIELAAARVEALGLRGVVSRLNDRFQLLTRGSRTVLPRHQTLRATLDWSYDLLPAAECVVLRRLAIFSGGFTEEAASAVAAGAEIVASAIAECVANLVTKSLVLVDVGGVMVRYRLPETIRGYALQKLAASGERDEVARRHAEYHRDLFERAEAEREVQPMAQWLAAYRPRIDNLRAALDWAFSPVGEPSLGVALTAVSIPLWFELSLFPECRQHAERAINASEPNVSAHQKMQLYYALAASLFHTEGPVLETCNAWTKVLHFAEGLGEIEFQLRALWGLWIYRLNSGDHKSALRLAEDFSRLAASQADRADLFIADRMIGSTMHYLGDQPNARSYLERARDRYVEPIHGSDIVRFQLHPRIATLSVLERLLWLQGFADQALSTAEQNVEDARAVGHAVSVFNALLAAGQVALLAGDLGAASRYVVMLLDHSAGQAMAIWTAWARGLNGMLLIRRGDFAGGLAVLHSALDELGEVRSVPRYAVFFGSFATALAQMGQIADGLLVIEEAINQCRLNSECWILAELLRIKGELLLLQGSADATAAAEDHLRQALDWAHRQGALSWELRAAMSFARLRHGQGRHQEARDLLAPVYGRFTEGFSTADLAAAKGLLDGLTDVTAG